MENSSALKFIGAVGLGILAYVLAKSAAFATSIGILGAIIGFIIESGRNRGVTNRP
jgi:hypothetical protein